MVKLVYIKANNVKKITFTYFNNNYNLEEI